jgi:hypothetical protein
MTVDMFWCRKPGVFVGKTTGLLQTGGTFTGTIREWYETLPEHLFMVQAAVVREGGGQPISEVSWRGDADCITILEATVLFKPDLSEESVGVIGEQPKGFLHYGGTIPVEGILRLRGTRRIELVKASMNGGIVLGSVTVLDDPKTS